MKKFPKQKINPIKGVLSGTDGDVSLEIDLMPFKLSIENYKDNFDSSIRLDGINIPFNQKKLEGKSFSFPVNPEEGYIDGSVYFFSAHNPVDVTSITFGEITENKLPIQLKTNWVLEFENTGFKNFETIIETNIEL